MTVARFMRDVVDPRAVAPSPPRRQEGDLHSEFLELAHLENETTRTRLKLSRGAERRTPPLEEGDCYEIRKKNTRWFA